MAKPELTEEERDARHAEKMRRKKIARDKIIATKTIEKGLLIVHTGKGKGKSTAAFGLVFRALGHGMKVGIVQFVKGKWETGERTLLERFSDQVTFQTMGEGFTWETQDRQRDIAAAKAAWEKAKIMIADDVHQVVLLDEPAAGLDTAESQALGNELFDIVDHGISILLIDHDMGLVLDVCDYIYVLDFGRLIAEGTPTDIRANDAVIEAYLGQGASA